MKTKDPDVTRKEDLREYYDNVCENANDAIVDNEKIIDTQGIVVSVGLLIVIFRMSYEFGNVGLLENLIVAISCMILILSFLIPARFVRQNRRMLNKLELENKSKNIVSKEDITVIRNKYITDGTHGPEEIFGMSLLETCRVVLLFIDVFLVLYFFISQ